MKLSSSGCQGVLEAEQGTVLAQGAPSLCPFVLPELGYAFPLDECPLTNSGVLLGKDVGGVNRNTRETAVLCIFNNIYLYIFSRSVHSVFNLFFSSQTEELLQ